MSARKQDIRKEAASPASIVGLLFAGILMIAWAAYIPPAWFSVYEPALSGFDSQSAVTLDRLQESLHASGKEEAAFLVSRLINKENPPRNETNTWAADPYIEQILKLDPGLRDRMHSPVLVAWLPETHRQTLLEFLGESSNPAVKTLLQTRQLHYGRFFPPVYSASGQALDTVILGCAMLLQGGHIRGQLATELIQVARKAIETGHSERLERFYFGWFTLGKRLTWGQLAEWVNRVRSTEDLETFARWIREYPESWVEFYGLSLLLEDISLLDQYLSRFPENGAGYLSRLADFPESSAAAAVIQRQVPIKDPWSRQFFRGTEPMALLSLAANQPGLALSLKIFSLCLGLFLVYTAWQSFSQRNFGQGASATASLTTLFLAGSLIFLLTEPLNWERPATADGELLSMVSVPFLPTLTSQTNPPITMDEPTLMIIGGFLAMQLIIYFICLVRLFRILREKLPAKTKLALLENEENLFDAGLYLGLGGTVLSLILIAMKLYDASLMAAYSSTLLGILFVAILKIVHLRPAKGKLILEDNSPRRNS